MDDNARDIELAKSVGPFFRLDNLKMTEIIQEVESSVARWREVAKEIEISRGKKSFMEDGFVVSALIV